MEEIPESEENIALRKEKLFREIEVVGKNVEGFIAIVLKICLIKRYGEVECIC